jgi:hypothetical protein
MTRFTENLSGIVGNDRAYSSRAFRDHIEIGSSVRSDMSFRPMQCEHIVRTIPNERNSSLICALRDNFVAAIIAKTEYPGCFNCGERFSCKVPDALKPEDDKLEQLTPSGAPVMDRMFNHLEESNQRLGQVLFRFPALLEVLGCSESTLYRIPRESGCLRVEDKSIILNSIADPDQCKFCTDGCRMSELNLPITQGRKETKQINEKSSPQYVIEFINELVTDGLISIDNNQRTLAVGAGKAKFEMGVLNSIGFNETQILSVDSSIEPDFETGISHDRNDIMAFMAEHIINDNSEKFSFVTMFGVEFLLEKENVLRKNMFEMLNHILASNGVICISSISLNILEAFEDEIKDLFDVQLSIKDRPAKDSLSWITSNISVALVKKTRIKNNEESLKEPMIDSFDGKPSLPIQESISILRQFGIPESEIQELAKDRGRISERAKYIRMEHHLDPIPEERPISDQDHWSEFE